MLYRGHGINQPSTLGSHAASARLEASGAADGLVRVLERHPEDLEALPGYVWLEIPRKARNVQAREFELRETLP